MKEIYKIQEYFSGKFMIAKFCKIKKNKILRFFEKENYHLLGHNMEPIEFIFQLKIYDSYKEASNALYELNKYPKDFGDTLLLDSKKKEYRERENLFLNDLTKLCRVYSLEISINRELNKLSTIDLLGWGDVIDKTKCKTAFNSEFKCKGNYFELE